MQGTTHTQTPRKGVSALLVPWSDLFRAEESLDFGPVDRTCTDDESDTRTDRNDHQHRPVDDADAEAQHHPDHFDRQGDDTHRQVTGGLQNEEHTKDESHHEGDLLVDCEHDSS